MNPDDYTYVEGAIMNVKDGTYFRSEHDFDHGAFFKRPDMKFTQMRRSSTETLKARLSAVWMIFMQLALVFLVPALLYSVAPDSWAALAVSVVSVFIGVAAAVFLFIPRERNNPKVLAAPSLFQYGWFGYLPVPRAPQIRVLLDEMFEDSSDLI